MRLIEYINKNINDIPKSVTDWANQYAGTVRQTMYCSELKRYCGSLYEIVYGVKATADGIRIQKLFVVTEGGTLYNRNCYYTWGGMSSGFHSYGYTGKGFGSYYSYGGYYGYESEMFLPEHPLPTEKIRRTLLTYFDDVEKLDSSLKYYHYMNNPEIPCMEYIRIYRKYPKQAEMLMKFGLYRMISLNNCEKLSKDPVFHRWLERHHDKLRGYSYQTAHNSWKKNPEGSVADYLDSLVYRIQCGREIGMENKEVYVKILEHTTQEKLVKWFEDNNISPRSYNDYIRACDWLKLDFSDTKVLFPKNFQEVHDDYTTQYGAWLREQQRQAELRREAAEAKRHKELRDKAKTLGENLAEMANKFSFLAKIGDEYLVKVARSKLDLIDEGSALHICVGKMDYDRRMAEGRSIICFIRKVNAPDVPFVCAEVKVTDSQLKLVQCYGENNHVVPEISDFTSQWMSESNRLYKTA